MRKGLLITIIALAGCWSAAAQEPAKLGGHSLALYTPAAMQQANLRAAIRVANPDARPVRAPQLTVTIDRISDRTFDRSSQTSWVDSSYELTETPFVQEVHVPVLLLGGGRLELGGYYRMLSAENFQMGLPGGGTLDAWSVGLQSHLAVLAPRMDQGAGFSVRVRLHGSGLREMHCHGYQTVNHAIAFIRGS
jgi:hypothetical protein